MAAEDSFPGGLETDLRDLSTVALLVKFEAQLKSVAEILILKNPRIFFSSGIQRFEEGERGTWTSVPSPFP